jgi:outer membrane protein W
MSKLTQNNSGNSAIIWGFGITSSYVIIYFALTFWGASRIKVSFHININFFMKVFFKKLLTISFLTMTSALVSQVQAQSGKVWSIGPEVGVNFSKFGRDANTNDMKAGILAGAFVTYSIVNNFGITTKFLLSQRGYHRQNTILNKPEDLTLNYIEVPILARFFLNKSGRFRPNLFVGPSLNFLMGATNKLGNDDAKKILNYKDVYNTFDFGVTGGLGLNFAIADETRILLDARYVYGLSDVTKSSENANNQTISISAGVQFGF